MKLSYIITTYNLSEAEIRRCLGSLTRQGIDRDDYEAIVVDDESDISPEPVVLSFAEQMNIRFFRQAHARQGTARNLAFREAQGEFIQIVDGDDYLFAHTSDWCLKTMQEFHTDMVIFSHVTASTRLNVQRPEQSNTLNIYSGQEYMERHTLFGSCCTMCFRRQLLGLDGNTPLLFTENTYIEDEAFVTRLVWRTPQVAVSDFKGYVYVQRPTSTTLRQDTEHINDLFVAYFRALDDIIHFAKSEPRPHKGLDRKIHWLSVDILRRALRQNDWQQRFADNSAALRRRGLFPLPKANYSWKYTAFRFLAPRPWGQRLLHFFEQNPIR